MKGSALILLCAIALAKGSKRIQQNTPQEDNLFLSSTRNLYERSKEKHINNNENIKSNCNPEEAPTICAAPDSDGVLVAHENCDKFYKCANGLPVAIKCPDGLLYNPHKEYCDWANAVDCGDRVISQPDDDNNENCNCNPEEAPAICAALDSDSVLVAHENCDKFYKCANGLPVAIKCPDDLLYNPHKEYCDWANAVDCGDRVISQPDDDNNENCKCNPEEAPAICAAPDSDGVLVAHENCDKFYKCANGLPVAIKCPDGLLYNPHKEYCDWANVVDCGDRVISEPDDDSNNDSSDDNNNENCKCNPEEAPAICAALDSDGVLVAHENCDKFYKCANGLPVAIKCPDGLLYNPHKEYCDWANAVDCGDRVISEPDDDSNNDSSDDNNNENCKCNPEEAPAICAAPDSDGVLVAHENCDKFYKCANGLPVAIKCPDGLLYNPHKEYCDWANVVDCGDRVISQPDDDNNENCNCNPEEAPAICAALDSDGVLVAHENCDKFYKCANGLPVAIKCPDGLLYNPHKEYCDWANAVDCGDRVISQPDDDNNENCKCNPEEAPAICAAPDSDGVLVAHENCDKFYKCANGLPVAIKCPDGLLYDPHKEYCDWANAVDCGDRVISEPDDDSNNDSSDDNNNENCKCNPEEAPAICAAPDSDGVLVAHENCDKFYKCANGLPVAIKCPDGLLYNPHKEYCDWANAVDCGDRVISEPDDDSNNDSSDDNNNENCKCNPEEAPAICAAPDSDGVLVAHENCDKFYKCANGLPVAIKCPDGLLYNPHKEYCDWANAVDCGDRVISQPDDDNNENCKCNPEEAPAICAAPDSDGVLVAHENCDKFYKCTNGLPVAIKCSDGLLYNPHKEYCDWANVVDCGDRVISQPDDDNNENCNCNPEEAPAICAALDSDGVLVAHENCDKFYKCANGLPVAIKCPDGLLYNPHKEYCDWANAVDCGDRVISQPDDDNNENCKCNPEEAPAICAAPDSDGVLVAHENCDKFYKCANGLPVAIKCPDGLLYNPHKEYCDWANVVDCGDRVISEPDDDSNNDSSDDNNNENCKCNPEEAPAICAAPDSDGVLVAHENCDKFYKCANGLPVAIKCPDGLLYNPHKEYCDWANAVDCGDRVISEPDDDSNNDSSDDNNNENCKCNPEEAPAICAAPDSDGVLVAHENCDKFYKCANGLPVAIKCPDGLLYNPHKEYCDWANAVDCGDRVISQPDDDNNENCKCNPEEAPAICAAPDSDGVLVAHENCDKFYKCTNGLPVAIKCPDGLLYNPHKEYCDWANVVDCGDRVISQPDDDNNENCNCNPEEAPAICAALDSDGVLVAHENCDKFYKCANGLPVAIKCPDGLLYNPHKEYCDWANAVDCGDRVISQPDDDNNENCKCNPEEAPAICAAPDSDGVLVAHENCDKFYKCANGLPVAIKCPDGLLYNPHKEYCDWANVVDCGDRVISEPDDDSNNDSSDDNNNENCKCNPEEAPAICAAPDSDGVLVAHENCDKFYKCANGLPVAIKCPDGLLYNPHKEYCDWANVVDCGDRVISEPDDDSNNDSSDDNNNKNCKCNPEEAPAICAALDSDGVLVAHENCDKFYKCANGLPVAIKCPDGLLYNPHKEYCDWANAVDCGDRVISQPDDDNNENCNCNPEEAPAICAALDSDGVLVAHENCDKFYKCANGLPVAIKCPDGLLYNPHKEYCDWANTVDCGDRVISKPDVNNNGNCNSNPEEAPTICASLNSNGVLVAHENCDKFYKCANGKPVAIQCPDNTLYNPHKEYCDWASTVECGNRVISKSINDTAEDDNSTDDSNSIGKCNCNPEEAPAICLKSDSDGTLIAHESCNKLYICAHRKPVVITCPKGLFYNPYKEICDWARNIECGVRLISYS